MTSAGSPLYISGKSRLQPRSITCGAADKLETTGRMLPLGAIDGGTEDVPVAMGQRECRSGAAAGGGLCGLATCGLVAVVIFRRVVTCAADAACCGGRIIGTEEEGCGFTAGRTMGIGGEHTPSVPLLTLPERHGERLPATPTRMGVPPPPPSRPLTVDMLPAQ